MVVDHFVEAPFETPDGTQSDHAVLVVRSNLRHVHDFFSWVRYKTREIDDEGKRLCNDDFQTTDWKSIVSAHDNIHDAMCAVQNRIEDPNDKHFPWKSRKIRSTDDPWINDKVRRAIRRRKRAYDKNKKRSARWKILKRHTDDLIAEEKFKYYEKEERKLHIYNPKAVPYNILKNLTEAERPKPWAIQSLCPSQTDELKIYLNISQG